MWFIWALTSFVLAESPLIVKRSVIDFINHGDDFGARSPTDYSNMAREFGTRTSDNIIQVRYDLSHLLIY